MLKLWFFYFLSLFVFPVLGEVTVIPSEEVNQIVVKGSHWKLNFKHSKGPYRFELEGPANLQSIEGTLKAISDNYKIKDRGKGKQCSLNVTGPSASLSLFVFQGKIQISHWQKPVFIFSQQAEIQGSKNKGSWELSVKRGNLKLNQFTGSLTAKGFNLDMDLKKLKGDFQIQFNEGRLKTAKGEGTITYTTDKGNVVIKNWKGDVVGESVSGSLRGFLTPGRVHIFSKKGSITMSFLSSRPLITAFSESGRIRSPKYMHKKYAGKSLTVTGRLRGQGKQEGDVSLKTDRGDIYIR